MGKCPATGQDADSGETCRTIRSEPWNVVVSSPSSSMTSSTACFGVAPAQEDGLAAREAGRAPGDVETWYVACLDCAERRETALEKLGNILGFVAAIVGATIGLAFALRGAGVHYPATWACLAGGLIMGLGGPVLNRRLRRVMLGNRAGSAR